MARINLTHTVAMDVGVRCSLDDLRAFMAEVADDPGETVVDFEITPPYHGNQFDSSPGSVTISVDRTKRR
jgi:hypothetical protein